MDFSEKELEAINFAVDYAMEKQIFASEPELEINLLNIYRTLATKQSDNLENEMSTLYTALRLAAALPNGKNSADFATYRQSKSLEPAIRSAIDKLKTAYQFE